MEGYFSGTVIVLYMLAHHAAEPIFLSACFFGSLYSLVTFFLLRFGGCGRMIRAGKRAKRFTKNGVISGDSRQLFAERCLKGVPIPFRTAYYSFVAGSISSGELAAAGIASLKIRRKVLQGGAIGGTILFTLLVFLTYYFIVPFSETLLRTVICAFHGTVSCLTLRFVLYFYGCAGEKGAARFSEIADAFLLRKKEPERKDFFAEKVAPLEEEGEDIRTIREWLREVDGELHPLSPHT